MKKPTLRNQRKEFETKKLKKTKKLIKNFRDMWFI